VNELTSDLFDLILRLAVNDDNIEQGDMSIPLRLVTPSAVQSVSIVLQAVSDHLGWLLPISISSRYRFIHQNLIQTFKCNKLSSLPFRGFVARIGKICLPSDNMTEDMEFDDFGAPIFKTRQTWEFILL
jgi:hypothetical protein